MLRSPQDRARNDSKDNQAMLRHGTVLPAAAVRIQQREAAIKLQDECRSFQRSIPGRDQDALSARDVVALVVPEAKRCSQRGVLFLTV